MARSCVGVRASILLVLSCAFGLVHTGAAAGAAAVSKDHDPLAEAVAGIGRSPQAALELVRGRVAYRPYAGFLKGPTGTWWDGTANAADAADLLREVLRRKGIAARLAFGTLPDGQVTALLQSVFTVRKGPKEVQDKLPGDAVADPVHDPAMRAIAADHVWVQARQGSEWVDLDPVAPRQSTGNAAPKAGHTRTNVPPKERRRLRVEVLAKTAGAAKPKKILHFEAPVATLIGERIFFVNYGLDPKSRDRRPARELLTPVLVVGKRVVKGQPYCGGPAGRPGGPAGRLGEVFGPPGPAAPSAKLEEAVVQIALLGAGRPDRTQRRYLFLAGKDGLDRMDDLTAFCVTFGAPPEKIVKQWAKRGHDLAEQTKGVKLPPAGTLTPEQKKTSSTLLHGAVDLTSTMAMWLAANSHRMLADLDRAFGTLSDYDDARVLCVSLDTRTGLLSTDLVFDSVRSWARPGTKVLAPWALVAARGRLEADLEGAVLAGIRDAAKAPAGVALTVRSVFKAADAAGIQAVALIGEEEAQLGKMPLPRRVKRIIGERLGAGRVVLLPERPVRMPGQAAAVTAWYEIDRDTGEWVGVLEDGRHATIFGFILIHKQVNLGASIAGTYWSQFSLTIFRYAAGVLARVTPEADLSWATIRVAALSDAAKPEVRRMVGKCLFGAVSLLWQTKGEAALTLAAGQLALLAGQTTALLWLERNT